jgi:hypothetical protein
MTRDELAHILRSASRIAGKQDIVVIGSQSIPGSLTDSELPDPAIASVEADLASLDDQTTRRLTRSTGRSVKTRNSGRLSATTANVSRDDGRAVSSLA